MRLRLSRGHWAGRRCQRTWLRPRPRLRRGRLGAYRSLQAGAPYGRRRACGPIAAWRVLAVWIAALCVLALCVLAVWVAAVWVLAVWVAAARVLSV